MAAVEEMLKQALETANATDSTDTSKKESKESEWYPLTNFAFMLRVELAFDLPCRAIKGLRRENEFDYIQEGGLNDYVHMKRKPISRPFTFQVERYVGLDYLDPLPLGVELVLPVLLFVNPYPFRNSSFFKPVRSYAFMGCTVTAKDYGELNAESSGLLVETTTIAFREMACIDLPSKWLNKSSWDFAVTKNKDGKIVPSYEGQGESNRNTRDNLLRAAATRSKEDMEKIAKEHAWEFDGTTKDGNAKRSYLQDPNGSNADKEATWEQMKNKAALWEFNNKAKVGKGKRSYRQDINGSNADKEATQDQMNEKAVQWKFAQKTKAGNDKRSYLQDPNGSNTPKSEKTMDTMNKAARKWPDKSSADIRKMKTPEASLWKFKEKTKAGEGKRSYLQDPNGSNVLDKEATKEQMGEKAVQWAFDNKTKAGNGKRSYLQDPNGSNVLGKEATQEQMNKKASQWAFAETTKAGNGKRSYLHREDGTNTPAVETTKENMNEKAVQWAFDNKTKAGNGNRRYLQDPNGSNADKEAAKDQMNEKAVQWAFDEKTKAGNGKRSYQHVADGTNTPDVEQTKEQMQEKASIWPPKSSAVQSPSSKAESRKWPKEKSAQKAPTTNRKKTGSSSQAKKASSSKSKARLWPKTSSAQTAQTANIKGASRKTSSSPRAGR